MKRFYFPGAIFFLILFLIPSVSLSETKYVGELLKITLRNGKGTDQKILSMVESGEKVEVLEKGNDWTRVRLPGGKTGWVLDRFLTSKKPCSYELSEIKEKQQVLIAQNADLLEENKRLKAENEKINAVPKADFSEHEKLKKEYNELVARLNEETTKREMAEKGAEKDNFRRNIIWFLSGAGVLIIGFIIGFSAKRQRRRPYLS